MSDFDALLRHRAPVDPIELRRLVASVRARVLGRAEVATLGRYILEEKLGEGGFGAVYRAFDPRTQRHVAAKVMRPDAARATQRSLRDEARALAAVDSEHVVRVLDFGVEAGRDYFIMELLSGTSLRSWRSHDLDSTLLLLEDVMRGVQAIHDRGLVHCDLKPDNVVVDGEGKAVIVDFGLALPQAALRDHGRPLGGSPPYSAPEQYVGHGVDQRADQYALGKIGLELLQRHARDDRVWRVFQRATARDPAARFASIAHLRRALAAGGSPWAAMMGSVVATVVVVALSRWAVAPQRPPAAPQPGPPSALRQALDPIDALLQAGDLRAAQAALDALPRETRRDSDATARADAEAMYAELALARGDVDAAVEHLSNAVWTAVDARADRTTALHATQLASVLTLELGDAEGGARMNALAWAAIERDGSPPDLVARYWFARSLAERHTGSPDAELDAARKAVAAAEGLPAGPPWNMLCNLAAALAGQEHLDEALATLDRAAALGAGDEADAAIESLRAEVHSALGDDAQALAHAERAVALATRAHGPTHPSTLEARHYLGAVLIPIDPARAVAELKSALAATGGHENLAVLGLVAALASAEAASGESAAAEVRLLDLLAELDVHGDVPATDIASVWADLGDVRAAMQKSELAADAYATALARLPPGPYAETLRADIEARRDALSPRPR